ncbi:hypothetical protein JOD44_001461 [Salimicrobium jeotgali]|nr:hypothetical protein [Salimicrobium jeotgali]
MNTIDDRSRKVLLPAPLYYASTEKDFHGKKEIYT